MHSDVEEFSIGEMHPVVPLTGETLEPEKDDISSPLDNILDSEIGAGEITDEDLNIPNNENPLEKGINNMFDYCDRFLKPQNEPEDNEDDLNAMESEDLIVFDPNEDIFRESTKNIDEDIKDIIKTLNDKGYITKYSCSGHPSSRSKKDIYRDGILHGKLYSTARIVFAKDYDLPTIPKHWELKVLDEDKVGIYVKPPVFKITNGLPIDAFSKWKAKYMGTLETWANKLPKQGSEETTMESVLDDLMIDCLWD